MRLKAIFSAYRGMAWIGVFTAGVTAIAGSAGAIGVTPSPGPAPLLGIGLPVAGAVIAAVVALRHFGRKD